MKPEQPTGMENRPLTLAAKRWQLIDQLFTEIAQEPTEAWPRRLDEACPNDAPLRREVESLLNAHREAGDFLNDVVAAEARQWSNLSPGARIGAYEVIRHLGSGGMGAVYLAARTDESYEKQVAIKVLRHGFGGDGALQRFLQERQILARLEHPNIARLFDAATSDDGRPCIVMEFIAGKPLDRYCDEENLSLRRRLQLFRSVCSGVQAAHQNLIVHRDLKPGNILVTADGIPKLVDFGIAKLLPAPRGGDPQGNPQEVPMTLAATQPMTPEYASPEQVRNQPITTASDVYSLGVLLYHLLTGEPPYRVAGTHPSELERIICEQIPAKPSTRIGPTVGHPRHRHHLRGDLDTIVLKALHKDPQQRYVSAEHLADDLRRHQEGLPILARRPTYGYRLAKFLRRHRGVSAMAGLAVALLLGGIATTSWQAHVAKLERQRAEEESTLATAERARAEEVSTFMVELFQVSDPQRTTPSSTPSGRDISARDLLDLGAERLATQAWDQPEVQARLMRTVGQSYLGLGLYPEAENYLQQALDVRRRILGDEHLDVAESLDDLAALRIAKAEYGTAEDLYRQGLDLRRRLLGAEHQRVAESLNNLGQTLHSAGDLEAAEPILRQALDMKQRLEPMNKPSVANGYNNLAGLLIAQGKYGEAETLFHKALILRRRSLGASHPAVAETYNNLGLAAYRQNKLEASENHLRQALALRRQAFGDEHPLVGRGLGNLAAVLLVRQDYVAAEPMLHESLALKQLALGSNHPDQVPILNSLGRVLEARGAIAEAQAHYRRALSLQRPILPAGEQRLASSAVALGQLLLDSGEVEEAHPLLAEARHIRQSLPADDWRLAEADSAFGAYLVTQGRMDEAETLLVTSHRRLEAAFGGDDPRVRRAARHLQRLSP